MNVVVMYHKLGIMIGKSTREVFTDKHKGSHVVLENPFIIEFSNQGIQLLPVTEFFTDDNIKVYANDYHGDIHDAKEELAAAYKQTVSPIDLPPTKSIITG